MRRVLYVIVALSSALLASLLLHPRASAAPPPGFTSQSLIIGLTEPAAIAFTPDGRMLILERGGNIWVVQPGASQVDPAPLFQIANINTDQGERGAVGLALDPNFSTNGYYYVFYTANTPLRDRVSRFTASGNNTVAGSEVVLWQDNVDSAYWHHAGTVAVGPDGKLYISTGDHTDTTSGSNHVSQRLDSYHGKILRINSDGTVPTNNPFYDGAGPNLDAIWARGFRNPFRFSFDSVTGAMYIGDVGGNLGDSIEELNLGAAGANYGWPICEGTCSTSGMTNPIFSYSHNNRDASITAGFVYHGTQFPTDYRGSFFYADYAQNWIRRLVFDASGNLTGNLNFEPADGTLDGPYGDIVDLKLGPDGALYYVDIALDNSGVRTGPGSVRRISYSATNQPPVISSASGTPTSGPGPTLTVNFAAVATDPEGATLTYLWDFGDGTTSTTASPSHTYDKRGPYTARLTVSDGQAQTLSDPIYITVGIPPVPVITSPANGATFRAGDVITYSATATDADGTLTPANFSWTIIFHHDTHIHPAGGPFTGTSGTFTIPTTGHDFSGNTSYEFILTVTDSDGLQSLTSVTVYPQKVNLTFDTSPSGLGLNFDQSSNLLTPFVRDSLIGFQHTIEAPLQQTVGGVTYNFVSWSDGGAALHDITTPATDQTYVALYQAAPATPTATPVGGAFPSTAVLDTFNRADGAMGANWSGATGGYSVVSNSLDVGTGGDVYWKVGAFAADQEAYVSLTNVDTAATELDLLLKSQNNTTWGSGAIEVWYDPVNHRVQLWTYAPSQNWVQHGADIPVTFTNGDQFGARVTAGGLVYVYQNGVLLGTRDVTGWPFAAGGGSIGIWTFNAGNAVLDSFGGGTVASGPVPTATPTSLPPTSTPTALPPTATPLPPTPTNTPLPPTPTNTPLPPTATPTGVTSSDLIFQDGFESGSLNAWTSSVTNGGALSVNPAAALVGANGLRAAINSNTSIYVADDTPAAEPRYRARFYFDPNSTTMSNGNAHYIFYGYTGASTVVLRVELRFQSPNRQLRAALVNNSTTWTTSNWFTISDAPHYIEIDWKAATAAGANNGYLTFWIDGTQQANLTGVANDTRRIDRVQLGAAAGIDTGTRGTYYFDAFQSGRQTYIGPAGTLPPTPTNTPLPPTATNTPLPPTATNTAPAATNTPLPPTATNTAPAPTNTPLPPTATNTPLPPTPTNTAPPPTSTPLPPTPTNTPLPPTPTNTAPPPTATPASLGLEGYWRFNEAAGSVASDSSGFGNNGAVTGATWTAGKVSGAISFDGASDWVSVAHSSSLSLNTNRLTIAYWVYPNDLSAQWSTIVQRSNAGGSWFDWQLYNRAVDAPTANHPVFRIDSNANGRIDAGEEVQGDIVLQANTWYYVAVTYDGVALNFYIDGTLRGTMANAGGVIPDGGHPIWVGGNDIWGEYFTGKIDEFRIYNRALSQAEIQALMTATGP